MPPINVKRVVGLLSATGTTAYFLREKLAAQALIKVGQLTDNLREHRELVAEQEVRHQEVHQKFEAMLNNVTMQYETLVNFTDQRSRLDRRATVLYDNLLRTETRLAHVTDSWRSMELHSSGHFPTFP